MSDERIASGVGRIERALARIAAAKRPAGDGGELEALRARHDALRAQVAEAVRELDEALARG